MNLLAQAASTSATHALEWLTEPPQWHIDDDGRLHVTPAAQTDFFRPIDRPGNDNAALLAAPVTGDFTARTRVWAELAGFGDAAALTVRAFGMPVPAEVLVGIHAQAPFVGGCRARFDYLEIDPRPVADFRSGE